jgi:hypothetical protein
MLLIAQDVDIYHGDWKSELSNYVYNTEDRRWELKRGIEPNGPGIVDPRHYVCPEGLLNKENGYELFSKCVSPHYRPVYRHV